MRLHLLNRRSLREALEHWSHYSRVDDEQVHVAGFSSNVLSSFCQRVFVRDVALDRDDVVLIGGFSKLFKSATQDVDLVGAIGGKGARHHEAYTCPAARDDGDEAGDSEEV